MIETEWISWQKKEQIPATLNTGLFTHYEFFKLLEHDEEDGLTYVIQYFTSSLEAYRIYLEEFAPMAQEIAFAKWGSQFISFATVMRAVN